jgi:hypothetical protein
MDGSRFDNLTKSLVAAPSSRRQTLRRLAGGGLAAILGGAALGETTAAQDVGIEAYNLFCRQEDVGFFCENGTPANQVTTCKSPNSGCVCAESRDRNSGPKCVVQPAAGCPSRRAGCTRNRQCGRGEVCIRVAACCRNHPDRGMCVRECPS